MGNIWWEHYFPKPDFRYLEDSYVWTYHDRPTLFERLKKSSEELTESIKDKECPATNIDAPIAETKQKNSSHTSQNL